MSFLGIETLLEVLPFALVVDKSGVVSHVGNSLSKCTSLACDCIFSQEFRALRPADFSLEFCNLSKQRASGMLLEHRNGLEFQAQSYLIQGQESVLVVCMPKVSNLETLTLAGLNIRDFPAWERTIDYVLMIQARLAEKTSRENAMELASLKAKLAETSKSVAMEAIRVANELKSLLDARTLFLRIISHELRNPMHVIAGCVSLIEESPKGPPPIHLASPLRQIRSHAGKIVRTIEQATTLLSIMSPDLRLYRKRVCIEELVKQAMAVNGSFSESQIEHSFDVSCSEDVGSVFVDAELMGQALACLRELAEESMAGFQGIHISLYLDCEGASCIELKGNLQLSLDFNQIFTDPLKTVSSGLSRGDVGIGLNVALIQKVFDLHGGEMVIHRSDGFVSSLLLRLPVCEGDDTWVVEPNLS